MKKVVTGASAPEDFIFPLIALADTNQGPEGGVTTDLTTVTATAAKGDPRASAEGATQAETTTSFGGINLHQAGHLHLCDQRDHG